MEAYLFCLALLIKRLIGTNLERGERTCMIS